MNNFDTIIARMVEENDASIHLNEHAGFVHFGTSKEIEPKFGGLLGVHIMQKMLDPSQSGDSGKDAHV